MNNIQKNKAYQTSEIVEIRTKLIKLNKQKEEKEEDDDDDDENNPE